MNFFCFHPNFIDLCEKEFDKFLDAQMGDLKSEFLMPKMADYFIKTGQGVIDIVPTTAKWFGVTYKEDAPVVQESINKLVKAGTYPENLWN
jgi:hypothetical protein